MPLLGINATSGQVILNQYRILCHISLNLVAYYRPPLRPESITCLAIYHAMQSHPQHVMFSHTAPQFIRQLVSAGGGVSGRLLAPHTSSGWIVAECTPYACRHSLIVRACAWKLVNESLSTTM